MRKLQKKMGVSSCRAQMSAYLKFITILSELINIRTTSNYFIKTLSFVDLELLNKNINKYNV